MSCKVIANRPDLVLQPLFRTSAKTSEPKPLFRTESAAVAAEAPAAAAVDVRPLQERIRQLEAALERDTRMAREMGKQEGEAAGREQARAEFKPVLEKLNKSLNDLATLRSRIRQDSEADLVKLSLCIARRVLRRELTVDPEAVHGLIKAAFEKVQSKDIRKVRVHPDFQTLVRSQVETSGVLSGSDIVPDLSLQPGDVVVETRVGDLDASIESQLREIERGFADRLNR